MRPWMKLLTVGGVVSVALSVGMAGERLFERQSISPNKSKRSSSEFFSRGGRVNDADIEAAADAASETSTPTEDTEPKRYVRQKSGITETTTSKPSAAQRLEQELFGEATETAATESKPASRTSSTLKRLQPSSASQLTNVSAEEVELLPPPQANPLGTSATTKTKPFGTRVPALSDSDVLPAGFTADAAPKKKTETSEPSKLSTGRPASRVVPADFEQKLGAKPQVQPVRAEQSPSPFSTKTEASTALESDAKKARVSVIQDNPLKTSAAVRAPRTLMVHSQDSVNAGQTFAKPTVGSPAVSVEWIKRSEILVGKECACDLIVKNTGKVAARQVVVEAFFPASVRLTRAEPQPSQADDHLEWSFPELSAGDERIIHITMIPSQRGDLATTANVRFTGTAASVFQVEEPLLKVAINAPQDAIVGDPLVQTVTVSNPGTGVAQNVRLKLTTTAGLEHSRGDRSQIELGALSPGESRTVRLSFTAVEGGEQTLEVEAAADSGLRQIAEATVQVIAPALSVVVEGPALRYVGRDSRYTLTITNEGAVANNNVRVTHRVPKGFTFVKADKGGTFNAAQGTVDWFVGHLEPEQAVQLKLQLLANALGEFEHHVQASTEHGFVAKADTTTKIEGSASLVLEIHDLDDPVETGKETAYEVRISNTGSKAAQNVGLALELPSGLELLSVQSATEHLARNGIILFNDVPALAPGKTALYRIHVRGNSEGNHRVRARLTSESIDQELISEEITKFYAE